MGGRSADLKMRQCRPALRKNTMMRGKSIGPRPNRGVKLTDYGKEVCFPNTKNNISQLRSEGGRSFFKKHNLKGPEGVKNKVCNVNLQTT